MMVIRRMGLPVLTSMYCVTCEGGTLGCQDTFHLKERKIFCNRIVESLWGSSDLDHKVPAKVEERRAIYKYVRSHTSYTTRYPMQYSSTMLQ